MQTRSVLIRPNQIHLAFPAVLLGLLLLGAYIYYFDDHMMAFLCGVVFVLLTLLLAACCVFMRYLIVEYVLFYT